MDLGQIFAVEELGNSRDLACPTLDSHSRVCRDLPALASVGSVISTECPVARSAESRDGNAELGQNLLEQLKKVTRDWHAELLIGLGKRPGPPMKCPIVLVGYLGDLKAGTTKNSNLKSRDIDPLPGGRRNQAGSDSGKDGELHDVWDGVR